MEPGGQPIGGRGKPLMSQERHRQAVNQRAKLGQALGQKMTGLKPKRNF
jgi:hypothetical protein